MAQDEEPHSTIASDVALTRKGERYAHEHANREYFAALKKLRKEAAAEIDRLLAFLDDLDGDTDLEDDSDEDEGEVDEPSLGWTSTIKQEGQHWLGDRLSTREPFVDAEIDDADKELECEDEGAQCEDEGAQCEGGDGGLLSRRYLNRLRKRRGQKPAMVRP